MTYTISFDFVLDCDEVILDKEVTDFVERFFKKNELDVENVKVLEVND